MTTSASPVFRSPCESPGKQPRRRPNEVFGLPPKVRRDLVTHHAPPVPSRPRRGGRCVRGVAAPATESSWLGSPGATSETTDTTERDERAWVARVAGGSRTGASAPPAASKERCWACSTPPASDRGTVRSNVCNALNASQLTAGAAITRRRPHAAGSNIQAGTSIERRLRSSSSPHRHTDCPCLTRTSYTATARPNRGCHG